MNKFLLISVLSFLFYSTTLSYTYLYVQDPRGWKSAQGSIDEASVSVKPHGIYMENGLYLKFSAKNSYTTFTHDDSLEVIFTFDLPEGSIVNDLWLWIGNDIIKALIMDKWTASTIYENIVKRRRDPAILFKRGNNSYELRIYPMAGDEYRKIKLTYLVPAQWNEHSVTAPLPVNLISASYYPVPKLSVIFKPDTTWHNARIQGNSDINFFNSTDSAYRDYKIADIPSARLYNSLNFEIDAPIKDGLFISKLSKGNEGYYQMVTLPNRVFDLNTARKLAILIDYDASKGDITTLDVLNTLKGLLLANFTAKDSFNLIFSNLDIRRISLNWLPGDSATIVNIFDSLSAKDISKYSNLPPLLNNGIDFINENGKDAGILLISNSEQFGDYQVANPLINDLMKKMLEEYPVYIVDFIQNVYNYHYINGYYYYGNEYFFSNLSRLTDGEYINTRNGTALPAAVSGMLQSVGGFISSFDLYTTMQNGFCYGRFGLDPGEAVYLTKPITQVGKFTGTFPFVIHASGVYKSDIFTKNITISEPEVVPSDTMLETIWTGKYITSLEAQPQTNNLINEIIDYSVTARVLSLYTAMIALEPNDTITVCYDCMDESEISPVEEEQAIIPQEFKIEAYPNPFNAQVTLKVTVPAKQNTKNISFKIYNILGQVVKTFESEINTSGIYQFEWNGKNDYGETVSSGIYLFVVQTPDKNISHKIVLMK